MAISANSSKLRLNCRKSRLNWIILRLNFFCALLFYAVAEASAAPSLDTNIGGYGVSP